MLPLTLTVREMFTLDETSEIPRSFEMLHFISSNAKRKKNTSTIEFPSGGPSASILDLYKFLQNAYLKWINFCAVLIFADSKLFLCRLNFADCM